MISRSISAPLIALMFCSVAFAQGGCTQYHVWEYSGGSGDLTTGPGGSWSWQPSVNLMQATYGGIGPSCTYKLIYQGYYGDCFSVGYRCSNPPKPPASSAPETNPGPGCPSCGQPISLATGNTYILQADL